MTDPTGSLQLDGPLVDPEWLEAHLDDPSVRVIESTVVLDPTSWHANSGRAGFDEAHIPGSDFVDLIEELSDPSGDVGLPPGVRAYKLPTAEQFARAMTAHGVGPDTTVIAYDRAGGMWAARLWWMLRVFGHDRVAVLDGGWARWTAEGRATSSEPPAVKPSPEPFVARLRPELLATVDEVAEAIDSSDVVLVNALWKESFTGEVSALDRPGRIPGSVNVPFSDTLDEQGNLRSPEEVRKVFADAGVDGDRKVITYCGGGIAASLDALALATIGVDAAVYDGSLVEWVADPDRPLEVG